MIIKALTYEVTDATIDSQIIRLQASGADVFMTGVGGCFAPMAIRKAYDIGWRPKFIIGYVTASISATLAPAGLERSTGVSQSRSFKAQQLARWAGTLSVSYQGNGVTRTVQYKSDSDMAAAAADLKRRIAAVEGTVAKNVVLRGVRGWEKTL